MRIVVLGAGVVGVTTAWYLARRGITVTVVDRADAVAGGASRANAGQLSYSFTDALARPAMLAKLPGLLCGLDPALRLRVLRQPGLWRWAMDFLRQCTPARSRGNTCAVLELALHSARLMEALRREIDFEFSFREAGKLVLLPTGRSVGAASALVDLKRANGCDVHLLTKAEACSIEPALLQFSARYRGAVYAPGDQVGDAGLFADGLCRLLCRRFAASLKLSCEARGLELSAGRVRGVKLADGVIEADAVVACLGAASRGFLRAYGIDVAILPVRGYSVTLPQGPAAPGVSVSDTARRIVFSRLDGRIRIAGFADFLGFDTAGDPPRIRTLVETASRLAPAAADYEAADRQPWGGFRAMTPDSRPVTGATRIPGLYVNSGHGMLGWTLACATAERLAASMTTD